MIDAGYDEGSGLLFGERLPGLSYRYRPAAFGILEKLGRIALVRVTRPGDRCYHDLPGGAIDGDETAEQALIREFAEETGLVIATGSKLLTSRQLFRKSDGEPVENAGSVFEASLVVHRPELKVEDDHALVWMEPPAALVALRHESHAWAVVRWLRRAA
jgi:8-oxo-dGTP diphosphatase